MNAQPGKNNNDDQPAAASPDSSGAFTVTALQSGPPCCVPEPMIEVERLCLRYGRTPVLQDVSLTINRGCISALIGPSGCGKTSFLSSLNRLTDLIPSCRVEARIRIDQIDVYSPKIDVIALRRKVGMIFQKPNPFPLSIRRNIELPLREHGLRHREQLHEQVELALRHVGLWEEVKDRLDVSAFSLSGGQQQRLCIARALALRPDVLLLDEPCSALDPIATGVIEELIESLRGRLTAVVVTHNLDQARRIADYAAFFSNRDGAGRLIEHGSKEQIFQTPQDALTQAYVNGRKG